MMKRHAVRAALGAAFLAIGFAYAGAASAAPFSPGTVAAAERAAPAAAETVRWVCGPYRCYWQPGARVVVPGYAAGWRAPRYPWCYWSKVRGPYGGWRWVQVCRR
ncbi:hypothetical protein [Xanthobacter tagetidis]|uniref:Uncharacterized protein n=1 Tax=Xanthobacter tagetidis TaxID=60216 RepID=A0A3L7A342_9HYPH|nr:hypothetical protein [Xanthobacter tagetidis]MBB6307691.1 hypothetical protein [Xanthobacter tagetidis]RLP74445.1 hypothetical protein D9R14_18980 [Xanthobacter tagetidis]